MRPGLRARNVLKADDNFANDANVVAKPPISKPLTNPVDAIARFHAVERCVSEI